MIELALIWISILVVAVVFSELLDMLTGPEHHHLRERRRHARRTARAMRRMSEIRQQTAQRMDCAERRGWR